MKPSMLDKLSFIESDVVPKENAKVESFGTSIKITHSCGCVLVQHFAVDSPLPAHNVDPACAERLQAERDHWVEFCPEHQKAFDEFITSK